MPESTVPKIYRVAYDREEMNFVQAALASSFMVLTFPATSPATSDTLLEHVKMSRLALGVMHLRAEQLGVDRLKALVLRITAAVLEDELPPEPPIVVVDP